MQDYDKINRELWNRRTQIHIGSTFYQEDDFMKGMTTLNAIEIEALGDVTNSLKEWALAGWKSQCKTMTK